MTTKRTCFREDNKWLVEEEKQGETCHTGHTSWVSVTLRMPLVTAESFPSCPRWTELHMTPVMWDQKISDCKYCVNYDSAERESLNRPWNSEMFAHSTADCFVRLFVVDLYIWWFICISEAICLLLDLYTVHFSPSSRIGPSVWKYT